MTVHLEPGRFYAGVSLPFFITHAMVQHRLESLGFTNVSFHDRKDIASLAVDPKKYPSYDDSWSEWIEADWTHPKKDLDFEKHWSWLLVVPTKVDAPPSSSPVTPATPPPSVSGAVVGLFIVGIGLLFKKVLL